MKQLIKEIKNDINAFELTKLALYKQFILDHPNISFSMLNYFATRLSLFDQNDNIKIKFNSNEDPTEITITIYPDYSS